MSIAIALPDERLSSLVETYGFLAMALEEQVTVGVGLVAFNLSDTQIKVDGKIFDAPALLGLPMDPVFIRYSMGPGPVVTMRLSPGAFDRMFGIDMAREKGVVALDPNRHSTLAAISSKLRAADYEPQTQFRALDGALIELLPDVKPIGLAERFWRYCMDRDGDVAIAQAAEELGCTLRSLERACASRLGRTPKRISRGIRVARTHMLSSDQNERPELLSEFPFADLPHYLNEMRRITGMNRSALVENNRTEESLPYRFFWPDGSEAVDDANRERWMAERQNRSRAVSD